MPDGAEWWTMGYLFDVILTRDPFTVLDTRDDS